MDTGVFLASLHNPNRNPWEPAPNEICLRNGKKHATDWKNIV